MTLRHIAFSNLKRRKAKACFVLLGLLIGVSATVAFVSLVDVLTHDITHKLEMYGANILIIPKTEQLSLSYGGLSLGGVSFEMQELLEESLVRIGTIENAANIAAVGPMVLGAVESATTHLLLAGVAFEESAVLRPWWKIVGHSPHAEGALLGSEVSQLLNLSVGDFLALEEGARLEVTGILEHTGSQDDQLIFVPLKTAQKVLGKQGKISMVEVAALCAGCPVEEMVVQISEVLPAAKVMAIRQVVEGRMETLKHLKSFSYGLSILVMSVGALLVFVTMIGSVRERTSEFGILGAVGFRKGHIVRIVLLEAGIISVVAGVLGYLLGLAATQSLTPLFAQSHQVHVPWDPVLALSVLLVALLLGLGSSIYPAVLASNMDPNEALRAL